MRGGGDRSHDTGTGAPWSASAGGLLLATTALSALSLDGATYPCPGPPACQQVVLLRPVQKWLLLGLGAGALAFAVGVRLAPWSRRSVAATASLAVSAAGLTLYWWTTYAGRLAAPVLLATLAGGAGATGLLTYSAHRGPSALPGPGGTSSE